MTMPDQRLMLIPPAFTMSIGVTKNRPMIARMTP